MGSQTLKLKWAGHTSNMTSELQELYLSGALFDVTIACGEFSLKAHKTVLSASSTFFRKLFIDNPCKHPILIMTDVDFEDLKSIVEFMYQGEIHIYQEQLAQFLKTAERLKIKGLTNVENMNLNNQSELCDNSHFSKGAWEHTSTQPKLRDTTEREKTHNSSAKVTDCAQTHVSQRTKVVKSEDLIHSDNNSCIYWQSECFNQTPSSSLLPDCIIDSPPAVKQQMVTTVSHKAPTQSVSHELLTPPITHKYSTASASQPSSPSTSQEISNKPVSPQNGVPLNTEAFTSVECQTKSKTSVQAQNEISGEGIVTYTESQINGGTPMKEHDENTEKDVRCTGSHIKNSSTSAQAENENTGKAIDSRIVSQSQEESVTNTPSNADSSEVIQLLDTQSSSKDRETDGDGESTNKLDQNHTDISRDSALSSMDSDRSSSDDEECMDCTSQAASFCEDLAICSSVSPSPSLHSLSYCSSGSASSDQSPTPKKLQKLFRRKALHFRNRKNDDSEDDDKHENHSCMKQPQEVMHLKIEEHSMEEDCGGDLTSQASKRPMDLNEEYELSRQRNLIVSTDIDQSIHHCYYYSYDTPLESTYDHKPFIQDKDSELEESRRDERRARELKIPISNYDIINLPLEIFNERMSKYDLNETQLQLIRDIRRRGKNKVAAQNCRKRKLWQIMNLQEDLKVLIDERNSLRAEQESILSYKHIITDKYNQLYKLIKENTSSDPPLQILPDTLHQPTLDVGGGNSSIPFDSTSSPNANDSGSCSKDATSE